MNEYAVILALVLLIGLPLLARIWTLVGRDDRTAQDAEQMAAVIKALRWMPAKPDAIRTAQNEEQMAAVIKALLLGRKPKAGVDE